MSPQVDLHSDDIYHTRAMNYRHVLAVTNFRPFFALIVMLNIRTKGKNNRSLSNVPFQMTLAFVPVG